MNALYSHDRLRYSRVSREQATKTLCALTGAVLALASLPARADTAQGAVKSDRASAQRPIAADGPAVARGVRSVAVQVERLNDDVVADGLSSDAIRSLVETKLTEHNITVIPVERILTVPGNARIYVNIATHKIPDSGVYAFNIVIALKETVTLQRVDGQRVVGVTTWQRGAVGHVGKDGMGDLVQNVGVLLNDFFQQSSASAAQRQIPSVPAIRQRQSSERLRSVQRQAPGAPSPARIAGERGQAAAGPDYWPFFEGSRWTLESDVLGVHVSQPITIVKLVTVNGKRRAVMELPVYGNPSNYELWEADAAGVGRLVDVNASYSPAYPVIKYPLIGGRTWRWQGTIESKKANRTYAADATFSVEGPQLLNLPYGRVSAMHVHIRSWADFDGQRTELIPSDYWFAPNIGIVRQQGAAIDGNGNRINTDAILSRYSRGRAN